MSSVYPIPQWTQICESLGGVLNTDALLLVWEYFSYTLEEELFPPDVKALRFKILWWMGDTYPQFLKEQFGQNISLTIPDLPNLTLQRFITGIGSWIWISNEALFVAWAYIEKYIQKARENIHHIKELYEIIVSGLILANKYQDDHYTALYPSLNPFVHAVAVVCGATDFMDCKRIKKCEIKMTNVLEWNFVPCPITFQRHVSLFVQYSARSEQLTHSQIQIPPTSSPPPLLPFLLPIQPVRQSKQPRSLPVPLLPHVLFQLKLPAPSQPSLPPFEPQARGVWSRKRKQAPTILKYPLHHTIPVA